MISRTHHAPANLGRHSQAQRRIRRTAPARLFCSTNGCATYLELEADGRSARCPICGLSRRVRDASLDAAVRAH